MHFQKLNCEQIIIVKQWILPHRRHIWRGQYYYQHLQLATTTIEIPAASLILDIFGVDNAIINVYSWEQPLSKYPQQL